MVLAVARYTVGHTRRQCIRTTVGPVASKCRLAHTGSGHARQEPGSLWRVLGILFGGATHTFDTLQPPAQTLTHLSIADGCSGRTESEEIWPVSFIVGTTTG
jgi:hypothetical protein